MPDRCCVPHCRSGKTKAIEGSQKISFFKPRSKNPDLLAQWLRNIPGTKFSTKLSKGKVSSQRVCEKHFMEHYIKREFVHNVNGDVVKIPRTKIKLTRDAVPTIFPDPPVSKIKRKRRTPKKQNNPVKILPATIEPINMIQNIVVKTEIAEESNANSGLRLLCDLIPVEQCQRTDILAFKELSNYSSSDTISQQEVAINPRTEISEGSNDNNGLVLRDLIPVEYCQGIGIQERKELSNCSSDTIEQQEVAINPRMEVSEESNDNNGLVLRDLIPVEYCQRIDIQEELSNCSSDTLSQTEVVMDPIEEISEELNGNNGPVIRDVFPVKQCQRIDIQERKELPKSSSNTIEQQEFVIDPRTEVSEESNGNNGPVIRDVFPVTYCQGINLQEHKEISDVNIPLSSLHNMEFCDGKIFSKECTRPVLNGRSKALMCRKCKYLYKLFFLKNKRVMDSAKLKKLKKNKITVLQRKVKVQKSRLDELADEMKILKEINSKRKEDVLEEAIQLLPPKQQENVRHCFRRSKQKFINFTKEWILESLVMRLKSPILYKHLLTENILTLPAKRTLDRYLQLDKSGTISEKIMESFVDQNSTEDQVVFDDKMAMSDHGDIDDEGLIDEEFTSTILGLEV